jgi:hypothetical protein
LFFKNTKYSENQNALMDGVALFLQTKRHGSAVPKMIAAF